MNQSLAFEDELTKLLPRLRRFAHGLCRNSAEADDLTQMAVERALRSREQFQEGSRLDSWCYRILRNIWVDTARASGRRQKFEAPQEEAAQVGSDPREAIETSLELQRAMAAMQQLPDEQREVVALILIEGFGYREAAEMLGLPIGTVSSRLVRGRNALLQMLGGPNDDG